MVNIAIRRQYHDICKKLLSLDRSCFFVAVLDSTGKLIVGHEKEQWPEWPERETGSNNKLCCQGYDFYREYILGIIKVIEDRNAKNHVAQASVGTNTVAARVFEDTNQRSKYYVFGIT